MMNQLTGGSLKKRLATKLVALSDSWTPQGSSRSRRNGGRKKMPPTYITKETGKRSRNPLTFPMAT